MPPVEGRQVGRWEGYLRPHRLLTTYRPAPCLPVDLHRAYLAWKCPLVFSADAPSPRLQRTSPQRWIDVTAPPHLLAYPSSNPGRGFEQLNQPSCLAGRGFEQLNRPSC